MTDEDPIIPARRLSAKGHLSRAAKAPIASDAERYHLAAAQAEALADIAESLRWLNDAWLKVWRERVLRG